MDDTLEVMKKGTTDMLTEHLNNVDEMQCIKFTHKEDENGSIPFLANAAGEEKRWKSKGKCLIPTSTWLSVPTTSCTRI